MWRSRPISTSSPASAFSTGRTSDGDSSSSSSTVRSPTRRKICHEDDRHKHGSNTITMIPIGASEDYDGGTVGLNEETVPPLVVQVEAPATLSAGYIFWATLSNNGDPFPVRVPQGGVQSGQMLEVPLLQASSSLSEEDGGCEEPTDQHQKWHQQREPSSVPSPSSSSAMPLSPGPSGQWKDGLFSCFRLGFLHPHLWNAWLCPQVLLGQILVRIDMTWLLHHSDDPNGIPVVLTTATALGSNSNIRRKKRSQRCATTCSASSSPRISTTASPVPGASNSKDASAFRSSFRIIMILFLLLSLYDAFIAPPLFELRLDHRSGELELVLRAGDYPVWHHCIYLVLSLPATVWGVWVMVRLRASVRHRYGIPTGRLGRWEDLVCVSLCNCCVMSQIARQTADYETLHPASCCSPNGLLVPRGDSPSDAEGVAAPVASKRAPTVAFVFKARPSSRSTSSTSATCSFSSSSTSSSTSSASSFVGFSRRRGNSTAPASSTPSQPSSSLPSPPDGTGTAHRDVDVPRCRRVGSPDLCVATVV